MDAKPATAGPVARAEFRLTIGDYLRACSALARASVPMQVIGIVLIVLSLLGVPAELVLGADPFTLGYGILPGFVGVLLVTGTLMVPIQWYQLRKRPDLLAEQFTFVADESGVRYSTASIDSRVSWSAIRRTRQLAGYLFFDSGAGATFWVPRAAFAENEFDALRSLLAARNLSPV